MKPVPYSPLARPDTRLQYPIRIKPDGRYTIGHEDGKWFMWWDGTPKEIARQIFIRCIEYKFYLDEAKRRGNFHIAPFVVNFNGETDLYFVIGAVPEGDVNIDDFRAALITELDKFRPLLWFW